MKLGANGVLRGYLVNAEGTVNLLLKTAHLVQGDIERKLSISFFDGSSRNNPKGAFLDETDDFCLLALPGRDRDKHRTGETVLPPRRGQGIHPHRTASSIPSVPG